MRTSLQLAIAALLLSVAGAVRAEEKVNYETQIQPIFMQHCAGCHGEDARGMTDTGAPNLTDAYWTYGGDRASIRHSVYHGRTGTMPSWEGRLSPTHIKLLTLYVLDLRASEP